MTTLRNFFLDILFPRHCLGCEILLEDESGYYICRPCLREIKFINTFACAFCGSQVKAGITCPYCRKDHFLDRLLVTVSYENPLVVRAIKSVKYRFVRTLAEQLGLLMVGYLKKQTARGLDLSGNIVVPVPLHPSRLRWRGFNHAEIIARVVGEKLELEVIEGALTRALNNRPQADMLNKQSRIANMKAGTFRCSNIPLVKDQRVLLIDDISTTGSTLNDCARALKGAGAKEVIGLVFARGTTGVRNRTGKHGKINLEAQPL